jgi:hypothetical protein
MKYIADLSIKMLLREGRSVVNCDLTPLVLSECTAELLDIPYEIDNSNTPPSKKPAVATG